MYNRVIKIGNYLLVIYIANIFLGIIHNKTKTMPITIETGIVSIVCF